jgi:hypothetical protein
LHTVGGIIPYRYVGGGGKAVVAGLIGADFRTCTPQTQILVKRKTAALLNRKTALVKLFPSRCPRKADFTKEKRGFTEILRRFTKTPDKFRKPHYSTVGA